MRALSLLPPALQCVEDSMVLVKSALWTWWCMGFPCMGCRAGGTEKCEIGLSSVGKAGAATLCLSVSGERDAAVTLCPY